jgi:general secretion pathway protein A
MYETFFGLTGLPFQLSPDTSFFFRGRDHRDALRAMRKGLVQGASLMMLTGEIGAGKTTLLRTLLEGIDNEAMQTLHVANAQLDAHTLAETLCLGLGVSVPADTPVRAEVLSARIAESGVPTLVVIDEAQHLSESAFALIATLVDTALADGARLQICLGGQPELRSRVESAEQSGFRARIQVDRHLGPLDEAEVRAYIEHRLRKVGWAGRPAIDDGAFAALFACTQGIPRRINVLGNRVLLSAFLASEQRIAAAHVNRVAAELYTQFGAAALLVPAPPDDAQGDPAGIRAISHRPAELEGLPASPRDSASAAPILCVAGGQRDHLQIATLLRALREHSSVPPARLVRAYRNASLTLHADRFEGLEGAPIELDVTALSYEQAMADLELRFQAALAQHRPSAVIVCNGTDAALACGQVAQRNGVRVLHVGAGQRTLRRSTSADFTRMVVDQLSDELFTGEPDATQVLTDEGIAQDRIHCVGSLAIDALRASLAALEASRDQGAQRLVPPAFLADRHGYGLVWLSPAAYAEDRSRWQQLLTLLAAVSHEMPLIWVTRPQAPAVDDAPAPPALIEGERIVCVPAQPHATFIDLMRNASCVLADSWCVQDEAAALDLPCLMLGEHAQRLGSVWASSTVCVGGSRFAAVRAVWQIVYNGSPAPAMPDTWNGQSAQRIAAFVARARRPGNEPSARAEEPLVRGA